MYFALFEKYTSTVKEDIQMDCSISEKFVDFGCLRRQNIDWKKEAEDFRKQLDTATREKDRLK